LAQVDAQAVASIELQPVSSAELGMIIGSSSAKGIVVNFWGPNCGPCRQEFPHFLKLKKAYQDQGLEMIFVGVDDESDKEAMATFLAQNRVDFASYYRGEKVDAFLRGVDKSWSGVIPFTMVYDLNRNIIHARPGYLSQAKLEGLIQKALSLDE
jgi:thiol-disulfide isomerase/thioredoxin